MEDVLEKDYPIWFREDDSKTLGELIHKRQSAVIVGMKRVGISNFLRFFLNHPQVSQKYLDTNKHLFIPVDLNDLVEIELYPFWVLTLKRTLDAAERINLDSKVVKTLESLFLDAIQSKDIFLLIDTLRKSLNKIIDAGYLPSIFFIRFDRIKDALNPGFFSNILGLRDGTNNKLALIFTSFRTLDHLAPKIFDKQSLSVFFKSIYLKPAKKDDSRVIYKTYATNYGLDLTPALELELFKNVDGYIHYLHLAMILLSEKIKGNLSEILIKDERVNLQSEELWESLEILEQQVLLQIVEGEKIFKDKAAAKYLWDTGMVTEDDKIFSPLFENYIHSKTKKEVAANNTDFSKKENLLFKFLNNNLNVICERESIIEAVWSEEESFGVSDWAIDRLVARVRVKLKKQESGLEIVTIKTRGYKLVNG